MESEIVHHAGGGVTLAGPDATNYFRAITLKSSLKMYVASGGKIIPTRGVGIKRMLELAAGYTQKKYKRTEAEKAIADLDAWCSAMRAALPERNDEAGVKS